MFAKFAHLTSGSAAFKRLAVALVTLALLCTLPLAGCSSGAQDADNATSGEAVELAETTVTIIDADGQTATYTVVTAAEGATVLSILEATDVELVVEDGPSGKYISAINGKAAEGNSGWVYTVNGEEVMDSADTCAVKSGDTVEFSYITM